MYNRSGQLKQLEALMNNSERIKKGNGCAFPSIFGVQILGSTIYFDPNPYEVKYCLC